MAQPNRATFMRPDTFFGVCEAIGQDFGFNPLWLRLAFVPPVFFQPLYALAAYVALGLIVLASRWMYPSKADAADAVAELAAPTIVAMPAPVRRTAEQMLPLAA